MTRAETLIVEALSLCRFMAGSWDKRFVRNLSNHNFHEPLTPRQSAALWRVAYRFREQVSARQPVFREMIAAHVAASSEGADLPGERGRFEKALSLDPADWATRLVYADWLEDQGDAVGGVGQRWQGEMRRCPALAGAGAAYTAGGALPMNWQWMWHMGYQNAGADGPHSAPFVWHSPGLTWSRSRIEAERKLAECAAAAPATQKPGGA